MEVNHKTGKRLVMGITARVLVKLSLSRLHILWVVGPQLHISLTSLSTVVLNSRDQ